MARTIPLALTVALLSAATIPLPNLSAEASTENPRVVSLLRLVSEPERWQGRLVEVSGWLEMREEETALYFHREDADQMLVENAVWIRVTSTTKRQGQPGRYCIVVGRFSATDHGHLGAFTGAITAERISPRRSRVENQMPPKRERPKEH